MLRFVRPLDSLLHYVGVVQLVQFENTRNVERSQYRASAIDWFRRANSFTFHPELKDEV